MADISHQQRCHIIDFLSQTMSLQREKYSEQTI